MTQFKYIIKDDCAFFIISREQVSNVLIVQLVKDLITESLQIAEKEYAFESGITHYLSEENRGNRILLMEFDFLNRENFYAPDSAYLNARAHYRDDDLISVVLYHSYIDKHDYNNEYKINLYVI